MADRKPSRKRAEVADVGNDVCDKAKRDTERYEALAREHGADLSEEGFNKALEKIGVRRERPSK